MSPRAVQTEAMAGEAENLGTIVDQMVDAGADAVIGAVDGALDRIPGFDAITSAVNRGISQTSGRQFLQDFAEDVEFVPSGSGGWTLSSTASSAAKVKKVRKGKKRK